jgi:hypothetical protein
MLGLMVSSCGDKFLDRQNLTQQDEQNFYSNPDKMQEALNAVYSSMSGKGSGDAFTVSCVLSPDNFAGGGPEDIGVQGIDEFQLTKDDLYNDLWKRAYQGIFRANMIIMHIDDADYPTEEMKNQILGETYFLRAYFYFRLAKLFGTVPLITNPVGDPNQPKAAPEDIFALIGSDLKSAIELMPAKDYKEYTYGHATRWVAEGIMARVFLFYTGYYQKASLPLTDGGEITKTQVQDYLVDVINNSGHALVPDFRNLWPYSYDSTVYNYAKINDLKWVGENPENTESMFAVKFGPYAGWDPGQSLYYTNNFDLFIAFRNNPDGIFGKGWGWATVNPQLWNSFEDGDLRQAGSIIKIGNPEENPGYQDNTFQYGRNNAQQETGYYIKKYMPVNNKDENDKWKNIYFLMYGGEDNFQLWNMQDIQILRYSDILLMAAELECPNAQDYLDQVRTRAGLGSVPVTLENIKAERRHEFAFEGLYYFDLLRWHDAENEFSKVKNIPVKNSGADAIYNAKYRPETGGFLPIPPTEIRLSGGILTQNPGW